jgi:hypothetical protein
MRSNSLKNAMCGSDDPAIINERAATNVFAQVEKGDDPWPLARGGNLPASHVRLKKRYFPLSTFLNTTNDKLNNKSEILYMGGIWVCGERGKLACQKTQVRAPAVAVCQLSILTCC